MSDFNAVLVTDDRIANITDKIGYAVLKGGANITQSQYNAVSQSTSSHTFNVQCPSLETLLDRTIKWQCTVQLQITGKPQVGKTVINYGSTDSLACYPLHQLVSVMTATVNNNSISCNTRDILPALVRMNDNRKVARECGTTPTAVDTYYNYADGVFANNNVLGGYQNGSFDNDFVSRGSWVIDRISESATGAVVPLTVQAGTDVKTAYVTFTCTENLLLSPFLWYNAGHNNGAMVGIQNLNFVFNIGSGSRVWRSANRMQDVVGLPPQFATVTPVAFTGSKLLMTFLTCHSDQMLPVKCITPYADYPRYLTSYNATLLACPAAAPGIPQQLVSTTMRTSSISLNCVPDKLIIFVRKNASLQNCGDADSFAVINGISLNWNNSSGILASATQQDLYRMSCEAGSNQSWLEFQGFANSYSSVLNSVSATPLVGSILVLDFAKAIQLSESYYSCGSLGSFVLNVVLSVANQSSQDLVNPEIVLITMNSGVFVCEKGTSSCYTGILTKQMVLDASEQESHSSGEFARLVGGGGSGGGIFDSMKALASNIAPLARKGLELLPDNKYAKAAAASLGALGYGRKKPVDSRLL